MEKAVKSGVPTSFTFLVNLHRSRSMWFDKEMADLTITHTIKYNSLKKEYAVSRSWDSNSPVIIHSFEKAKKLMTEVDSLKVVPLKTLEKGNNIRYRPKRN
jgi:hypothetical protein